MDIWRGPVIPMGEIKDWRQGVRRNGTGRLASSSPVVLEQVREGNDMPTNFIGHSQYNYTPGGHVILCCLAPTQCTSKMGVIIGMSEMLHCPQTFFHWAIVIWERD